MIMSRPILHIAAPASPAAALLTALGLANGRALLDKVRAVVGEDFVVRGKPALLDAAFDEARGGRRDDTARVRELNAVMADDRVAGLVAARGGGWMTRILPDLDFAALDRRKRPLAVFGFSELTPFINLVAARRMGRGYYYMTPGFPVAGLSRWGRLNINRIAPGKQLTGKRAETFAQRWAEGQRDEQFTAYFRDVSAILAGKPPRRTLTGKLVQGRLPRTARATFFGGCMSLVTAMTAGEFAKRVEPRGKWIVLEDLAEHPHRIDRQIAHIKLAGWFERCAGVLVGDFHLDDHDQQQEVLEILRYHLPKRGTVPIITTREVGHTWPQAVLPLGKPLTLRRKDAARGPAKVEVQPDWAKLRCF
jgi:muramoyltetrapeptide carboxypeptidase